MGDEHHTCFQRDCLDASSATALESCLHSILLELGDKSPCVEYWWRDTWEHIEAHEDLDEELFEDDGIVRHPDHAHVLYLEVGAAVQGPTCVWEPLPVTATGGNGIIDRSSNEQHQSFGPLTTVPAVAGRLLRFDGSLMHAVPRPANVWLPAAADEHEEHDGLRGGKRTARPSKGDLVRSVVLFNTWGAEPPTDVGAAAPREAPETIVRRAAEFVSSPKLDALVEVMATPDFKCQKKGQWVERQTRQQTHHATNTTQMRVALLGDLARRRHPKPWVSVDVASEVAEALVEEAQPTRFLLHQ